MRAFKELCSGRRLQGQLESMSGGITSGSAIAAHRWELDAIAFNRLLG